ncbi:putative F-box associated interaction domain-containing protein [Medicago truncatula]|uniref:Putative F-box associated interaction domain-containing protein n=1 Tax=Medicago truncatula TaxID=3880 RepID=A0A396IEW3_MEDTR|nr:putative F-box associated interaction domain-containing protein [Medicago truncatula]
MFITSSLSDTLSFDFEVSIRNNTVIERPNPNFITPLSDGLVKIVSSCRGFIFLHHNSSFYLWNPSTRVHKQIPLSPIELNADVVDAYDCFYLYGFGYDQLRDDYLVVSVSCDPTLVHCYSRLEFFSLRDNTWKVLEGTRFPYMNDYDDPRVGSLFNGVIHWLAYHHDLVKNAILAFS